MHYFIEHASLPVQTSSQGFGPVPSYLTTKYNVTSKLQLSGTAKAFAPMDAMMIVQQSDVDGTLVNVVLMPIEELKVPFEPVRYIILRGLLKSSFVSGTDIVPPGGGVSELITRLWQEWDAYNTTLTPPFPDPTPKAFGYDTALSGSLRVEEVFDNSKDAKPMLVTEGEWIGNFASSHEIGIDVVTDTDRFDLTLAICRTGGHTIDVGSLSGFPLRAAREQILSFVDPAALFGLHYDRGISVTTYPGGVKTVGIKKETDLYDDLIDKFATSGRLYLDIRSELGYSYGYYGDYDDGSGNAVKLHNRNTTVDTVPYGTHGWPIIIRDDATVSQSVGNIQTFQLRVDDNEKPVLFSRQWVVPKRTSRFMSSGDIQDGVSTDWTKDLKVQFPNHGPLQAGSNVAYHLTLHYFRAEHNSTPVNEVPKNATYFDSAFCPINRSVIGSADVQHVESYHPAYVHGTLPSMSDSFSYVGNAGAYWDANRVVFYQSCAYAETQTKKYFEPVPPGIVNGFSLSGNLPELAPIKQELSLTNESREEVLGGGATQEVRILDISKYSGSPIGKECFLAVGLTKAEYDALAAVTGFSSNHDRYLFLEEVVGSPLTDDNGDSFRKYKVLVQGLDASTEDRRIAGPGTDIFVYSIGGRIFASRDFSASEVGAGESTYLRNFEEQVGYNHREEVSGKLYEDYFIDLAPALRTEVDGFISALAAIDYSLTPQTKDSIRTLVADSARDIFLEAVNYVQTDFATANPHPDDRPLYWARQRMEVALKSHPFFAKGLNSSLPFRIKEFSDLFLMWQLFEEESRNYTGVDFSPYPALKKVLITGFDPFSLNQWDRRYGAHFNVRQSNPSGAVALYFHGKVLKNTSGTDTGYVQTMLFPVRYGDFDGAYNNPSSGMGLGVVERYIKPLLDDVDVVITVSQALPGDYNVDRYATATRGGWGANMGFTRGKGLTSVDISAHPEYHWIETTLPATMVNAPDTNYNWNYKLTELGGDLDGSSTPPTPGVQMFSGPGGNYLSNEIFFRVARMREEKYREDVATNPMATRLKTGHYHISKIQSGQDEFNASATKDLIQTVQEGLEACMDGV